MAVVAKKCYYSNTSKIICLISTLAVDRYRFIMTPNCTQLTAKMSCLISIGMGTLAIGMSIPLFEGTQLKDYVEFGQNVDGMSDILLCSDVRSGDMRYVTYLSIYM